MCVPDSRRCNATDMRRRLKYPSDEKPLIFLKKRIRNSKESSAFRNSCIANLTSRGTAVRSEIRSLVAAERTVHPARIRENGARIADFELR
jgi:hypothetical protein